MPQRSGLAALGARQIPPILVAGTRSPVGDHLALSNAGCRCDPSSPGCHYHTLLLLLVNRSVETAAPHLRLWMPSSLASAAEMP